MVGLEAEADEDLGGLFGPAVPHAMHAAQAADANRRANVEQPAQGPANAARALPTKTLSKMRGDVVVDANGDEWLKHTVSRNGTKQYWRCRLYHSCAVRGTSDFGSIQITPCRPEIRHTHDDSPAAVMARAVQGAVRAKAVEDRDSSTAAIVDNITRALPDAVAQRVNRMNLLRVANNAKKGHGADNVNCPVAEMQFTEAYSTTAAGEEFLLFDSRRTEPELPPIVIFASATGIQALRESRDWGSDGTFHVTPPQFDSLYTVHAMRDDHSAICAAYMLLSDRTSATYLRALRALIREARLEDSAPTSIMTAKLCGATSLLRGLRCSTEATPEPGSCFAAMAFVRPNDVREAFDTIVGELRACLDNGEINADFDAAIHQFCDYVRDNYVRRRDREGRWHPPRVANAAAWNCHYAALQGFHRTNNTIEAWNRQFGQMFPSAHCAMDKFIYRMQTDEDRTRQAVQRTVLFPNEPLRRGRRAQHVATDEALRNLVERYDDYVRDGRMLDFMRTVQYHLCKAKFPGDAPAEDAENDVDAHNGAQDGQDDQADPGALINAPALPDLPPARAAVQAPFCCTLLLLHLFAVPQSLHILLGVRKPLTTSQCVPMLLEANHAVLSLLHLAVDVLSLLNLVGAVHRMLSFNMRKLLHTALRLIRPVPHRLAVHKLLLLLLRLCILQLLLPWPSLRLRALLLLPGTSRSATTLRDLAEAATHRANQERAGASAAPSTTRKRLAGVARLTTPPKKQAMRREAQREVDPQEEEVQLPSQLSQQTAASQPLIAIDNTSGSDAEHRALRAGRGSRIADFIRRLS